MAVTDDCLLFTGNEKSYPFREIAKPCPRGHNLEIEGDNGGPMLMGILTENVEKRPIRVEYNVRALTLIADEDNRVEGLVVSVQVGPEVGDRPYRTLINVDEHGSNPLDLRVFRRPESTRG